VDTGRLMALRFRFALRQAFAYLFKWAGTAVYDGDTSDSWRRTLSFHVRSVMDWTEATPTRPVETLLATAYVVAPHAYDLWLRDATIWMRLYREVVKRADKAESSYVATFLIALALGNAPPEPLALVAESFEVVHDLARKGELHRDTWLILEPILPHLNWFQDWDKCERMRRGLVEAFVRHRWPASELRRCISNQELFGQLLHSAEKVEGGAHLLQRLSQR
jgi:hypothetical protein